MSAHEVIRCDGGCGLEVYWRVAYGGTTWKANRYALRAEGWHVVKTTGKVPRDICPACWKAGKR